MDFWTRLLGGGASGPRQSNSNNPQQRLVRFKRIYDQLRQTYERTPLLQPDSSAADTVRSCFQRLTAILQDEARSPAPHLCLGFAASTQIYNTISRIGAVAQNETVIREAVAVFGALIDSEEEEFLANPGFAMSLMMFVERTSGSGNLFVGEDTEGEIVELLFGIAAKIRLQPEILPIWFIKRDNNKRGGSSKSNDFVGVTSKEDFPLCYQLIDHVHHEGRIGDFARTGLLYIFESASKSPELEHWIVESDLPTLMASGLGALYSQLSRKLSILHPVEELPIILRLSDYKELRAPLEAENIFSAHLQAHLDTFLSYLAFWQDVLEHCRSLDVRHTLLDHLQVLFLQQLLYPSMLESSDMDGGSSVAVLTYLCKILDSLDHAEMIHLILQYLLALPDLTRPRSQRTLSRRTSLLLLTQPQNEEDRPNPALFNLVDLLQSSVTSANPQTVIAAMKLATVIVGKNHPYAMDTLLQTTPARANEHLRTHGSLDAEMETYLTLAEDIGGETGVDEAYDGHLKDTLRLVESHVCSTKILALNGLGISSAQAQISSTPSSGSRKVGAHFVRTDDVFLNHLLSILETFFTNNIEVNLALTESLISLISCPQFRLEAWTAVDPAYYQFTQAEEEVLVSSTEPEELLRARDARRHPTWAPIHNPLLLAKLQSLQEEVRVLRADIPDFQQLVTGRKQAFRLHEEISNAMQNGTLQSRNGRGSQDSHSSHNVGMVPPKPGAIPPRVYSESLSSGPSRSQSPRGRPLGQERRQAPTSSPGPSGRTILSQYAPGLERGSPSRSRVRSREMQRESSSDQAEREQIPHTLLADVIEAASSDALSRRIAFPLHRVLPNGKTEVDEDDEVDSPSADSDDESEEEPRVTGPRQGNGSISHTNIQREASLSHILTNVVILQEFILEVVAIMQVRASMFGEVRFV